MENKYSYKDAFEELQHIVSDIESGDIAVDELTAKINRASELLTICKAKLTASEEEVEKLLQKLENENKAGEVDFE
ncbi:exodeoxyribonuclease VII small subunit [Sphingobacterium sp.]|uniref:exodeoxyribonuclease VII small subunit n=1 Tax=Sphingobacterium sp. TaxID=341027 RepID=UPI0028A87FDF|nr:exodeoxyribonuclease VII small subunit [Sphingobacterium sp.]